MHAAARHGRIILVLGLIGGVMLPGLAQAMKPWLPAMVAALLFLAALRIGPRQAFGGLTDLRTSSGLILIFQIAIPLGLFAMARAAGLDNVTTTAIVLMASAAPLLGASNLTILTGNDPAAALRLLVVGLALLPLTIIPTLLLLPEIGTVDQVANASLRLLALTIGIVGFAFAVRHTFRSSITEDGIQALDGLSAIAMAVVVIGLMAAIGPALRSEPQRVLGMLALATACNFGLQLLAFIAGGAIGATANRVAYAVVSGNRNMAFFLAVLPASVMEPLFLFIGCYQVPMYLTPLILGRLYRKPNANVSAPTNTPV